MKKRPSSIARTLAVVALAAAFVVLIVVVSAALNGSGSGESGNVHAQHGHHKESEEPEEVQKKVPATYVIKSGDTLTAIAHATGVSVAKIERLNPEVDPQILIAGEKLKLK
jgi:LysM repeat protein